jgi:hypothetical protein
MPGHWEAFAFCVCVSVPSTAPPATSGSGSECPVACCLSLSLSLSGCASVPRVRSCTCSSRYRDHHERRAKCPHRASGRSPPLPLPRSLPGLRGLQRCSHSKPLPLVTWFARSKRRPPVPKQINEFGSKAGDKLGRSTGWWWQWRGAVCTVVAYR